MTNEGRIAKLEDELTKLRASLTDITRIHQNLGGHARMYESAVLAIILSHPRPDLLGPVLEDQLSRLEARIVAVANAEEHLQGAQDAQNLLLLALSEAATRFQSLHGTS